MAWYVISYDLKNTRDYETLWARLEQWGGEKVLQSVWIANIAGTASEIIDVLQTVVDGDDALAVIEITGAADWSTLRAMTAGAAKLKLASP